MAQPRHTTSTQSPTMANSTAASPLMGLPLEVRHTIFAYVAVRDTKPKKLLRYWFEKKEVKELVANEVAANPTGPAPRVVYHQEYEEDSDVPEPEDEEEEEGGGGEEQDGEDEDEDGEDNEGEDGDGEPNQAEEADAEENDDEDAIEGHEIAQTTATTQTQQQYAGADGQANKSTMHDEEAAGAAADETAAPGADITAGGGSPDADGGETMVEGENKDGENNGIEEGDEEDEEDAVDGHGANGTTATPQQPPPPPAPVVGPARKWRHIPNFMRITRCPPPVELLLASKQLNEEAKNWFYDVAMLRINATGSFAHTSFFEEAFRQITEAAFSPMENVRKVESLFAWDTTWLRADDTGCAEAIFPALLRQRSDFVHQILSQAPDLKEVTIHWHDSAQDNESANFMLDILAPFHSLNVHLTIKEHYIAADAKPHKRSIAGRRRVEFQSIVDAGLDRLF